MLREYMKSLGYDESTIEKIINSYALNDLSTLMVLPIKN